ncbi:lysozyme inhibitor LprI family protein [Inquilinus limosus]|uniref:Lysozyme inhibitor LprI-like N-terminal domain-containing protein n=1 Tax=Inquilinus limosus TaxID=171674 RepID=A0A211ZFP8_9PROT|nr:lysozyme inhibitor LprI family protein [Inquilinus limosus]OWJ64073.1 hypothetical protein BWR60_26525 [Inquilinus limosus]
MTMRSLLLAAAALLALSGPALALDCGKASTKLERAICGDKRLKAADAAMGQAYAQILKAAADDAGIHDMLVASQRRWLAARDEALADPAGWPEDVDRDPATWRDRILTAMRDRANDLKQRSDTDPQQFALIATAREQQRFLAQFTGGPFAGFATRCEFFPTHAGSWADYYACYATRHYQNGNRVCSVDEDWATYRTYETRSIAEVVDGKLKPVATCGTEGQAGYTLCPGGDTLGDEAGRWDLQPKTEDTRLPSGPPSLPKLDAEAAGTLDDAPWLRACLTDPGYPTADPASDGTTKKP